MLAVKEPRVARTRVYELPQILFCAVVAMLSGATTFTEMELVTRTRRKWIEKWIALPGIPSHDTFNRVLQLIEPQALEAFLRGVAQWLAQATGVPQGIEVDGKTVRGSQKAGKAIHLLNAWADKTRLVIGQRLVDGKSNEIMEVPQLLESLFLDGCVVTVDALNTQTAIAQKIVDKGADYVLPLKGNHPTHQSVVAAIMRDVAASRPPDLEQVEKDHGRLETRRCWVNPELSLFLEKDKWPKLQTLVRIDRTRYFADGHETTESPLFLSSLPADDHKAFVRRLKDLRQETVHRALRSIARECRRLGIKVTHILTDNGSEFLDEKTIGQIFGATVYYTHAYAGWEKGAVENLNRIIRFFYPRPTDFSKISQKRIKTLQWKLTAYPRPTKTRKVA